MAEYTGYSWLKRASYLVVLCLAPALYLVAAVTNDVHHLVYTAATTVTTIGAFVPVRGPLLWTYFVWGWILVGAATFMLFDQFVESPAVYRKQILVLLGAEAAGLCANLATHLGLLPVAYLDLTPLGFAFTNVAFLWALLRFDFLTTVPVARATLMQSMDDAVLALDAGGRVVDLNPTAMALFEVDEAAIGRHSSDILDAHPVLVERCNDTGEASSEVSLTFDSRPRHFDFSISPIGSPHSDSESLGKMVVLREVTALKNREQELDLLRQILTRVFRHNVRNQLTIIKGRTELLGDQVDGEAATYVTEVLDSTDRLLRHTEKARTLERLSEGEHTSQERTLTDLVDDVAAFARAEFDDITLESEADSDAVVVCHPAIDDAVRELVENAVRHHECDRKIRLRLSTERNGTTAAIAVEDNGPGIDPVEVAAISSREETDLTHTSGVGLWLVDWVAERSGGAFSLDTQTPLGGTRACLELPVASS